MWCGMVCVLLNDNSVASGGNGGQDDGDTSDSTLLIEILVPLLLGIAFIVAALVVVVGLIVLGYTKRRSWAPGAGGEAINFSEPSEEGADVEEQSSSALY